MHASTPPSCASTTPWMHVCGCQTMRPNGPSNCFNVPFDGIPTKVGFYRPCSTTRLVHGGGEACVRTSRRRGERTKGRNKGTRRRLHKRAGVARRRTSLRVVRRRAFLGRSDRHVTVGTDGKSTRLQSVRQAGVGGGSTKAGCPCYTHTHEETGPTTGMSVRRSGPGCSRTRIMRPIPNVGRGMDPMHETRAKGNLQMGMGNHIARKKWKHNTITETVRDPAPWELRLQSKQPFLSLAKMSKATLAVQTSPPTASKDV